MIKTRFKSEFVTGRESVGYKNCLRKGCLNWTSKGALVRVLKGVFCKSIRRLLEAKRACIGFELYENSLQITMCENQLFAEDG